MSVTATVLLDVMDLSGVFCVADSGVLQDTFLWNSMGMHTCSVRFSNTLYMELPQHCRPSGFEHQDIVLRLKKSIYGQVDSPKLFYEHLSRGMSKLGFEPSEADPCLFLHRELQIMVLNYCDDQIWLSPDNQLIEKYAQSLKDLGYNLELEPWRHLRFLGY